jgi:hypothetical protein
LKVQQFALLAQCHKKLNEPHVINSFAVVKGIKHGSVPAENSFLNDGDSPAEVEERRVRGIRRQFGVLNFVSELFGAAPQIVPQSLLLQCLTIMIQPVANAIITSVTPPSGFEDHLITIIQVIVKCGNYRYCHDLQILNHSMIIEYNRCTIELVTNISESVCNMRVTTIAVIIIRTIHIAAH